MSPGLRWGIPNFSFKGSVTIEKPMSEFREKAVNWKGDVRTTGLGKSEPRGLRSDRRVASTHSDLVPSLHWFSLTQEPSLARAKWNSLIESRWNTWQGRNYSLKEKSVCWYQGLVHAALPSSVTIGCIDPRKFHVWACMYVFPGCKKEVKNIALVLPSPFGWSNDPSDYKINNNNSGLCGTVG